MGGERDTKDAAGSNDTNDWPKTDNGEDQGNAEPLDEALNFWTKDLHWLIFVPVHI